LYEQHNAKWYAVAYTDGSLYDTHSNTFCRSGWGAYFGDDHYANAKGPPLSNNPTTFRAELRAVYHVFLHSAIDILVRCDCKGVVTLVNKIIEGEGYDESHNDADLLAAIDNICAYIQRDRLIHWMPAHLDEPKHKEKRDNSSMRGARSK
jgi:ribonuclease HI